MLAPVVGTVGVHDVCIGGSAGVIGVGSLVSLVALAWGSFGVGAKVPPHKQRGS